MAKPRSQSFAESAWSAALLLTMAALVLSFQNCGGFEAKVAGSDFASLGTPVLGKQTCSIGLLKNSKRIYRKNRQLIGNAIRDVFGEKALKAVESHLNTIPPDTGYVKSYESFVGSVTDAHVQSHDALANALASQLVSDETTLSQVLGAACKASVDFSANTACLQNLRKKVIEPLFSKNLSEAEMGAIKDLYVSVKGTPSEKLEELVYFIVQDPRFHYADMQDDRTITVPRELARMVWYSVPDEALLARVKTSALTGEGLSDLVESMLRDPKGERLLMTFFSQWLGLDELKTFNYIGNFKDGTDVSGLREAMIAEAKDFVRHLVFEKNGTLGDVFTSRLARTEHAGLSGIYGISPSRTFQDAGEKRMGILSRGAMVATGNTETKPILRGVRLTQQILCNPIKSPPEDIVNMRFGSNIDPTGLSTRQLNDARVNQTACMGCHSSINPFGHGLGVFDGLGRYIGEDKQYDSNGNLAKTYPLQTDLKITLDGEPKNVTVGHEFLVEIARSRQLAQCFDRQFYRFLAGQLEQETQSCGWTEMTYRTHDAVPVVSVIADVLKAELGGK